ncbi:hypothetical protein FSP39_015014 [Pinctada imbricata]|uniref:Uncharacterized protein n=1 Tax=Pinctada imbricata TaxID=66713 RepID=A0AA89BU25_PINIB|nr:hypothetical protein FSP39_015014 [Pinctada imbricata]
MERRKSGSLSSLTGSGTFTPPMSPRVESPRQAAAMGEKRSMVGGKGIQMQIQQLAAFVSDDNKSFHFPLESGLSPRLASAKPGSIIPNESNRAIFHYAY